ncbi:MAG: OsmC family protein [Pirellulales bacterium]|nr:OsmC family protein [Pirellulales bacterium]
MHIYQVKNVWQHGRECLIHARENPDLNVAAPPEFGGPEGVWSPEELLVASVDSCLLSTFLFFADRSGLPLESYSSISTGRMEKTSEGLRFTGIDVSIAVTVSAEVTTERIASLRLKEKVEKYCPVSASLNCPVHLDLEIIPRAGAQGRSV